MKDNNSKGGEKMEEMIEKRKVFGEHCPYCDELIKGNSESAVRYNLSIHIDKHTRKGHNLPAKEK